MRFGRVQLVVGLVTLVGLTLAHVLLAATPASAEQEPSVDLQGLDLVPRSTWGVSGANRDATQTPSIKSQVWDMVQVGDRMFVAGGFLKVQESKDSTEIPQSFIAAFDVKTGDWIDTWRPELDRIAYALETIDGKLLVGGEFQNVNGQAREGIVALDPLTGEIDPSFPTSMQRIWSDYRAMVRDIHVEGSDVYIAGKFSHIVGSDGNRSRAMNAAKVNGTGDVDLSWTPEVTGSSIWGIAVDPDRGHVHFSGFFSAVNGEADSGYFHSVNDTNGDSIPGLIDLPRNYPRQPQMFDSAMGDDLLFVGGEQHMMEVVDPDTHAMLGYHHTGYSNDGFEYSGRFAGGAYQVVERIGDIIFAGCHCTVSQVGDDLNHYSSYSGRTPHRLAMAYNVTTGDIIADFMPDVHSPRDGIWAITADTNGCVWLGGDLHVGGVDHDKSRWLGGFAQLCEVGFDPDNVPDSDAIVAPRSTWRYNDSGADLGTSWYASDYDDLSWSEGSAELGFGENNLGTELTPGYVTYYFRHSFDIDAPLPSGLDILLKADDGAIVRLNGTELIRDNLPEGFVGASQPALGWKGGADEGFVSYTVPASALMAGTNVLAVEVHNVWSGNNDLRFDLQLNPSDEEPPAVPISDPIEINSLWRYTDSSGQAPPVGWPTSLDSAPEARAEFGFGDGDEVTTLTDGQEAYYFSHAFNIDNPADWGEDLNLGLVSDDGAVVYLNGTEVLRRNMPDGPITWNTRPITWQGGDDEKLQYFTIPTTALVAGENVMSVEVHNFWPGNNDLSFDLSLAD